jgi:hypothetical protein
MKRIFLSIAIVTVFLAVKAQDSTLNTKHIRHSADTSGVPEFMLYNYTSETLNNLFNEQARPDAHNRLTVNFDYSGNSNTVPAAFMYNILFNNDINDKLKDRVDKRLKGKLIFEDNMRTGFNYEHYISKWGGSFFVSYNQRQMRVISGTQQTFETAFYGNARFEGDTADLSNLRFQNYIYNQYTAGFKKKVDYGNYQMDFGLGLSFLQVINNQDIRTNHTTLYTAPDGEYVDINYDLSFNSALQGAPSFFALNGLGGSGDFHLGFMNHDKWKVTFDLTDLGIMTFRKNPVNYSGANNVHFTGIVIPDLLHFSSQTFDTLNLDSAVRSYLPTKSNNSYSLFIPFTANIAFSKPLLHDHLVLTLGLQYHNVPNYYPYAYVKVNYFLPKSMVVSASLGAGGYSLCNVGFEFAKRWKYFDFAVGSANLLGLILPNYYTGTGLYLRLGTTF